MALAPLIDYRDTVQCLHKAAQIVAALRILELEPAPPVYWNTTPWTGSVLRYDDIGAAADPEAFTEAACEGIYHAQLKVLRTG